MITICDKFRHTLNLLKFFQPENLIKNMPQDTQNTTPSRPAWYFLPVLMGLFQSTLIAATPTFISVTGVSTIEWSILVSMPTLLFLFLSPLWGKWADRLGAAYLIRFCSLGLGLSIICLAVVWWLGVEMAFVPGLWFITIAITRIIYGLSASGVMPLCQSLAINPPQSVANPASTAGDQSLKKLGLVSASLSIGRMLGPLVLIIVASQVDWLLTLFSLLAIPLFIAIFRYSKQQQTKPDPKKINEQKAPLELARIKPQLALAFCITLFVGYLQFVLGPLFLDWLGNDKEATFMMSVTLTIVAMTALACQLLIVKHLNWRSPFILLWLSSGMLLAALALSLSDSIYMIMGLMLPIAVVIALLTPVYTRSAMAQCESSKGQISGKLAVCHTAGYPLGSLLAGLYYPTMPYWWLPLSAIAVVILSVSVMILWPQLRKAEQVTETQ